MIKNFMNVGIPTTTRCIVHIKQNAGVDDPRDLDDLQMIHKISHKEGHFTVRLAGGATLCRK